MLLVVFAEQETNQTARETLPSVATRINRLHKHNQTKLNTRQTKTPHEAHSPFTNPHVATEQMHVRSHYSSYPTTVLPDWLLPRYIRGKRLVSFLR